MSIRRTILVLFSIALSGLWGCSGDGTGPQPPEGDLWRSANGPFGPPPSQYVPGRTDREWLAFRPGHGVYRSPDRGERWEPFHEGLPTDAGRLFRRNSGDILFLGPTGLFRPGQGEVWEPVGLNQSSLTCMAESPSGNLILATQSGSLQRSSDGNNWTTLPAPAGQKAKALLAATDSLIFMITDGHTLLHSTNGGENWATFPGQYANPDDFSSMVWEDGFLFINTARGMLRFTAANAQPEIFFENSGTSYMCRSQGRLFFSDQAGTRFSTDRGDSWESLPSPPGSPRATALAIGPEGILLFSGINGRSYRSENGGNTWRRTGLPNSAVLSLAYDGQALWAGSGENSLQKQLPGSDTWQDAEGLPDYVRLVESDGQTHLYTAGRTGRFFFSSDAGSSWDNLPATPAFNASYDLLTNRFGHVFLATDIGLCRSTTRGVTWETITEGIGPHFLQSLGSSPDNILFGGSPTDGVYKSDDNGQLWLATNLPPHPVRAIAAFDSRILLAGTASGFLFLSEDGGQSWRNSEIALEGAPINFLLILDEKAVLLGSLGAGAWLSEDRGDSWREVNRGLGDLNLISGAYDPHSATIWLGSAGRGVFEGDFTLLKEYAPSTR